MKRDCIHLDGMSLAIVIPFVRGSEAVSVLIAAATYPA